MNVESKLCSIVWGFSAFYSLYLFAYGIEALKDDLDSRDFEKGWVGSRLRDVTDFEWNIILYIFSNYYMIFIGHIVVSQLVWRFIPQLTLSVIIAYATISIWIVLGSFVVGIIWLNILVAYFIHLKRNPLLCHIFFITVLLVAHSSYCRDKTKLLLKHDLRKLFIFDILFGWLNAKCLSFSLDRIEGPGRWRNQYPDDNLTMIFAYCLYLPTLFFGPMHQYYSFLEDMVIRVDWSYRKFIYYMKRLFFLVVIKAIVYDFLLHYLYPSAFIYRIDVLERLRSYTLCGFPYSLVIMFFLKYSVLYGFSEAIGRSDGIKLPPPPKCVSTIHLSSDLWRHFDRGLHLWLVKYYYKPLLTLGNNILVKMVATAICFSIVAIWHGYSSDVIFWCMLNFCAVATELTGIHIRHLFFSNFEARLSDVALKRLKSLIAAPFFIIMIITQIFFLANTEVGVFLFQKILFSFPYPALPVLLIAYTACHVSIELKGN